MGNVQHGSATHEVTIVTADEKGGFTNINVSISHYCIVLFRLTLSVVDRVKYVVSGKTHRVITCLSVSCVCLERLALRAREIILNASLGKFHFTP